MQGVGGTRRQEARHGTRFADAFLQDLAVARLPVRAQRGAVHGPVLLAIERVDTRAAEQRLHAEGPRLVRDDGHHEPAQVRVADEFGQHAHEGHGGGQRPAA